MRPASINENLNLKAPKIQEIESKQIIYISLSGEYSGLDFSGTWKKLWQFVKDNGLFTAGIEHLCIYYNDPKITASEKLRTDICLAIHKLAEPKGEVGLRQLESGKYAVFSYQGSYEHLGSVYDTIYGKWLPGSDYRLRDVPVFEKYLNNPEKTVPEKLKTEIYVPVE